MSSLSSGRRYPAENDGRDNGGGGEEVGGPSLGVFNALGVMELENRFDDGARHDGGYASAAGPYPSDPSAISRRHGEHNNGAFSIGEDDDDDDDDDDLYDDADFSETDTDRGIIFDGSAGGFFDNFPTFGGSNNNNSKNGESRPFTDFESRAIRQEVRDLSPGLTEVGLPKTRHAAHAPKSNYHGNKKYCFLFMLMLSFTGIVSGVFLSGWLAKKDDNDTTADESSPSSAASLATAGDGDDNATSAPSDARRGPIKNPNHHASAGSSPKEAHKGTQGTQGSDDNAPPPSPSSDSSSSSSSPSSPYEDLDLSAQGYPYARHTRSKGWVSWPPEHNDQANFLSFPSGEFASDAESCAARCHELDAPTGAYSVKFRVCWCNFVDAEHLCREPCVEEEYVDFGTVPIEGMEYCDRSVCDEEWYHSEDYCDEDVRYDEDECEANIALLAASSQSSSLQGVPATPAEPASGPAEPEPEGGATTTTERPDLSKYGYPYIQATPTGWITWPPEYDDDNSYEDFGPDSGDVSSLEECAARCETLKSPTGAWSEKYETCWCNHVGPSNICREPCIEEDYVDFGTIPLSDVGYCMKSICDADWYYNEDYCHLDVKFDEDACDATIEALSESSAISKPALTSLSVTESDLYPNPNLIYIKANALATIKKSSPSATNGGMQHLSVEGDQERVSFVRFEMPSHLSEHEVSRATLHLYLTNHQKASDDGDGVFSVAVDALPHARSWDEGTVSWETGLEARGSFRVQDFAAVELESGRKKQLYAVDVTSAISASKTKRITFRLSTESGGRLDFAGRHWKGGDAVPELMVTLAG